MHNIDRAWIEANRVAAEAGADVRLRQNRRMMYNCIYSSISGDTKSKIANAVNNFHEDGPLILHYIVTETFRATFSSAQAVRDQLSNLNPKTSKYNIKSLNTHIRGLFRQLRSTAGPGQNISEQEQFYYMFKTYKKIKSPMEWTSQLLFLENNLQITETIPQINFSLMLSP
jgi:hypothetical protein